MSEENDLTKSKEQLADERRHAEQAQKEIAAQLQGVINAAVDGIIAIDERGLIEWLNPAALRIFGYTAEEVIGKSVGILMPEPYRSQHDTHMANYLRTGQKKIIGIGREVEARRKDGSIFPAELAVSEVQLGNRRMFTGIVRDVTRRKETERALIAAKETAEAASQAKDHFLAVVSHELRTPLTPILAIASAIQEQNNLSPELREELAIIRRNAEQEARLVEDLLNLTRLNRGKIELHQEVVEAHALLRSILGQFQDQIETKGLELSMSLRAKQSHIWADPGRIQQVFSNLLSNAIKFTPEGGRVAVRTFNAEGQLRIEVTDTGIGIEPHVLPRIFSPFEQGEQTVSRKYGGLGLGLAIAKGIIDLHHGTLTATSPGRDQGTSFVVALEAMPAMPNRVRPQAEGGQANPTKRRILLVEDHPDTLRIVSKLLGMIGYEVVTATGMQEALTLASQGKFDLLVSDIGLPDGSGLDVMRILKKRLGIKGVALSGFGQAEDLRQSREAGFLEHLVKPVSFEKLESVIHRLAM
ncbi:MAG: PAS domain S-box protein [Bacillota bacterium]